MLNILFLFATAFASKQVPVVAPDFFTPGRAWTWDYSRQDTGALYSTETYTVIERNGPLVLIEMSTVFPGQGSFRAHHRLLVSVDRCLAAYRNPYQKQPWSFRMFYRDQRGQWMETEAPTTLAFEEKFNCNPHVLDNREFQTVFRNENREFMHKRFRNQLGSWFSSEGEEAGAMIEKNFNHGSGSQNYFVKRR